MNKTYYYLHTNGQLIKKSAYSVDSLGADVYFESDFVVKWWVAYSEADVVIIKTEANLLKD